jgi:hypothetical protein
MRDSANFGPGQTVVDRARRGRHKPCDVQSEEGESFTTPKSREERPTIVDHIVFEDGLHRFDERRSLPLVPHRPKRSGERTEIPARRGSGRAPLNPMHDEARLRASWTRPRDAVPASNMRGSARRWLPSVERRLAAGSSRRPSTLRHRGRSRQRTPHPGRRDAVSVVWHRLPDGTLAEYEKPPRPGRATRKKRTYRTRIGAGQGCVAQS